MDSIALISDLHGNLPALEAVLSDIKRRNISRIFCLGDLVGKGPHSEQVVDICQDVCEITEDVSEVLVCYSLGVYETQRTPKPPE